jgi:class 3 adenylate cyclase/predicted ATPase
MRCPGCNAEIAGGKFCAECGSPLPSRPAPESFKPERRQLTVFFSDIVGSTRLVERLDPEAWQDVLNGYYGLCTSVIGRSAAEYLGDGLVFYFGYPTAHEDDARRAVRAGLELVEAVRTLRTGGEPLRVRVGISSGLCAIVDVGEGSSRKMRAFGEATTLASRSQSRADPGTVVMSEATESLVRGFFRVEEIAEESNVKGFSRPVRLYRVLAATGATSRLEAAATAGLTPFVGRKAEVEILSDAWSRVGTARGRSILMRGEPGIGKSRLVEVVKGWIESERNDLLECRCSPDHQNSMLHPVIEMLEHRFGYAGVRPADRQLKTLEQRIAALGLPRDEAVPLLAPLFSIQLGADYAPLRMTSAKQRQRTLELLAEGLVRLAARRPTLFVVEDLHWADPTTLEVISVVLNRQAAGSAGSLMVLLTGRNEFPAGTLACTAEMNLQPLPREDSKTLMAHLAGRKTLPDDVVGQLLARAGGVPFYVEELTKAVLEDRHETSRALPDSTVPDAIRGPLMARIDRLGEESKAVAQLAATLGREFHYEILKAVSPSDGAALDRELARLVDAEILSRKGEAPNEIYTFRHALIQDAAYDLLLRKTRGEYHERIARTLAKDFSHLQESEPELLARHYEGAVLALERGHGFTDVAEAQRLRAEAISYWQKAGDRAMARAANREAIGHFRRALAVVRAQPQTPEELRRELAIQLALGTALTTIKGWASEEVEVACTRARDLALRLGTDDGLRRALWLIWTVHFLRGDLEAALEAASQLGGVAFRSEDKMHHVLGHHALGFTRFFRGELSGALEHAAAGIADFDFDREKQEIVTDYQFSSTVALWAFRAMALWLMGDAPGSEAAMDHAEKLAIDFNHPPTLAFCQGQRASFHFYQGEVERTWDVADKMLTLSRDEGFLLWIAVAMAYRGWAFARRGRVEQGLAELKEGLDLFHKTGTSLTLPQILGAAAEILWRSGRREEALEAVNDGIAHAKTRGERVYEAELHRLKAEILMQEPDGVSVSTAKTSLSEALMAARRQGARALETSVLASIDKVGGSESPRVG